MDRVDISKDVSFSRIVYGMWRLGDDPDSSPAHVQAKVEACLTQGITTMDQADIYGGYVAEALLGAAFKGSPGLRDKVELVSKCDIVAPMGKYANRRVKHYDTSPEHIRASVEDSLRDMATDRLDLLLIHRPDPMMDAQATGACLDALVAEGKVRAVGVSNFRPWDFDLLQSAMSTHLATNQIEMSLLHQTPFVNGDLAYLQQRGIVPMAWSPLAGGRLFGSEPDAMRLRPVMERMAKAAGIGTDALAVAWLLAHPAGIVPVMGTNSLARIATLGDAMSPVLTREDWFELWTAASGQEVA